MMEPKSILVNSARGGVVDESALLATLKDGRLCRAVLDATETEPPTLEVVSRFPGAGQRGNDAACGGEYHGEPECERIGGNQEIVKRIREPGGPCFTAMRGDEGI